MNADTPCTIRRLGHDDAKAWAGLRQAALEQHPLAFGSSMPDDPEELIQTAHERLATRDAAIFGAVVGDALVGVVGVLRQQGAKERHKAYVWGMYVAAHQRRQGVGRLLLQAATHYARQWPGVLLLHLSVSATASAARAMYEQHGFRAWGVEPRALCVNGQYADETHMVMELKPV